MTSPPPAVLCAQGSWFLHPTRLCAQVCGDRAGSSFAVKTIETCPTRPNQRLALRVVSLLCVHRCALHRLIQGRPRTSKNLPPPLPFASKGFVFGRGCQAPANSRLHSDHTPDHPALTSMGCWQLLQLPKSGMTIMIFGQNTNISFVPTLKSSDDGLVRGAINFCLRKNGHNTI